ncbi:hypothetical protein [Caldimonas sp. KR1-144]|uniref:hypothetical protein n=1 Tax=Caldimonas sp. KR1-144 TaxID=3400911 RepID=UPI003C014D08
MIEQSPLWQRVVAVIVLFRTDNDPLPRVRQLADGLRHVIVVDNSPQGHPALLGAELGGIRLIRNANAGLLAGAYNRAIESLERDWPAATHVTFLDEDSDVHALHVFLRHPPVATLLEDLSTAAVAPIYRDRATGLRGKHMVLGRFWFRWLPREVSGVHRVSFLINSMAVWRLSALKRIGEFDESLGVDHIDTDYCLRSRRCQLRLYVCGDVEFEHSIGQRRSYRVLGVQLQSGGHSPARRFAIARNTMALARAHVRSLPAFSVLCGVRMIYEAMGILLAEDHRREKLTALGRGLLAGLKPRRAA